MKRNTLNGMTSWSGKTDVVHLSAAKVRTRRHGEMNTETDFQISSVPFHLRLNLRFEVGHNFRELGNQAFKVRSQ
jgi:hypothetical protein